MWVTDRPQFRLSRTKGLFVFSRLSPPSAVLREILSRNGQPTIGKGKVWPCPFGDGKEEWKFWQDGEKAFPLHHNRHA